MDQSQWQKSINALTLHINTLEETINNKIQRFNPFNNLFLQLIKAGDRFASALTNIADTCDQQLLSNLSQTEESLSASYIPFKSGLLGLAQTWRQMAIKSKNEIVQPLKVFYQNYKKVSFEIVGKLKQSVGICTMNEKQILKNKESYYGYCQKLEKHKESQSKVMMKIQNGQISELQKFNKTTKALVEKISTHQRKYMQSVQKANEETTKIRKIIQTQIIEVKHNESSRVQFLKKIAYNQLKIIESSKNASFSYKQQTKMSKIEAKGRTELTDSLNKVQQFSKNNILEAFISHDELAKSKKNKEFEQQNPILMQLFKKIKQSQKASFRQFVNGCLQFEPACHLISIQRITKIDYKMVFPPEWQTFREKILSLQHYLFYYTFILNRELNNLPNYYIKLTPPFFHHLKLLLLAILDKIQMNLQGTMGQVALGTVYKILKLAERVIEKKEGRKNLTNMKILIEDLGKSKRLRDQKNLIKFFKYFVKKGQKKKNETKGMMNLTKSFFYNLGSKKDESQFEQDQFNALVELTHLMANLSLPIEITLPLLKNILKNNGEASFLYLKDILENRRNREQRQQIVMQEDLKFKLQFQYKSILEQKHESMACLKLSAERGFLDKRDFQIRLCCKQLSQIHYHIIYKLPENMGYQWRLISNPARKEEYKETLQKISNYEKVEQIQDIIVLDVNRSLHLHTSALSHHHLKSFLICYARNHPQMQYCQGMNYLAGYILLKNNCHQSTYGIFCQVMKKYFVGIFVNCFNGMKKKMYVFDRLFSIFHPDLSDHFKRQMITSECYIVGWIITAFTSTYQYTKKSIIIDWFWKRFYLWGWAEFYKFTMWLFYLNKDVLISANYDKCLQVLGEITKCAVMTQGDQQIFKERWSGELQLIDELYPITSQLISKLNDEYEHSEI